MTRRIRLGSGLPGLGDDLDRVVHGKPPEPTKPEKRAQSVTFTSAPLALTAIPAASPVLSGGGVVTPPPPPPPPTTPTITVTPQSAAGLFVRRKSATTVSVPFSFTVAVTGSASPVALAAALDSGAALPAGVTVTYSANPAPAGSVTGFINVTDAATDGNLDIRVTATLAGAVTKTFVKELAIAAPLPVGTWAARIATPPAMFKPPTLPPVSKTVTIDQTGTDGAAQLQAALNAEASNGLAHTQFVIPDGNTLVGSFKMPPKSGGTQWFQVCSQSEANGTHPRAMGSRIQASDRAANANIIAKGTAYVGAFFCNDGEYPDSLANASRGYNKFACLNITAASTAENNGNGNSNNAVFWFGFDQQTQSQYMPRYWWADRIWSEGSPADFSRTTDHFVYNAGREWIQTGCHEYGHGAASGGYAGGHGSPNGVGPVYYFNNRYENCGIQMLFGGGYSNERATQDVHILHNYWNKPASLDGFTHGNHLEFKHGRYVRVRGNVFARNPGRTTFGGLAISVKSVSQEGMVDNDNVTEHLQFLHNKILSTKGVDIIGSEYNVRGTVWPDGTPLAGQPIQPYPVGGTRNVEFVNNLFAPRRDAAINALGPSGHDGQMIWVKGTNFMDFAGYPRAVLVNNAGAYHFERLTYMPMLSWGLLNGDGSAFIAGTERNFVGSRAIDFLDLPPVWGGGDVPNANTMGDRIDHDRATEPWLGATIKDCVIGPSGWYYTTPNSGSRYGVDGEGLGAYAHNNTRVEGSVFSGPGWRDQRALGKGYTIGIGEQVAYPQPPAEGYDASPDVFATIADGYGFADWRNEDFRLTDASPYAAHGSDGGAPGADLDELDTETANVVTGIIPGFTDWP